MAVAKVVNALKVALEEIVDSFPLEHPIVLAAVSSGHSLEPKMVLGNVSSSVRHLKISDQPYLPMLFEIVLCFNTTSEKKD